MFGLHPLLIWGLGLLGLIIVASNTSGVLKVLGWGIAITALGVLVSGCAMLQEGPIDRTLQEAAQLPSTPVVPPTPPGSTVTRFDPAQGVLTGYRPRRVLPNGDATGGHYVDINLQDTAVDEVIQPAVHIPRAPKTTPVPSTGKVRYPKAAEPPVPVQDAQGKPPSNDVPAAVQPLLPPSGTPGVSINPRTGGLTGVAIP